MPKPKVLSGPEVVKILGSFGFAVVSQRGSHIKLRRIVADSRQTLTIPNHRELDRGTLLATYRQALRYVSQEQLSPHFFAD